MNCIKLDGHIYFYKNSMWIFEKKKIYRVDILNAIRMLPKVQCNEETLSSRNRKLYVINYNSFPGN